MSPGPTKIVGDYLARFSSVNDTSDDHALLDRFTAEGDSRAFATLVHRHGPMVMGVCRRQLRSLQDAEDAFQGTFLALARSARSIRNRCTLPGWLHRVAYRIAVKLRSKTPKAASLEVEPEAIPAGMDETSWREMCHVLDKELHALPEKFRAPMVLCFLEGLTRDEAAQRLGWSLNTVKRRIDEGRGLMKSRLLSRGVSPVILGIVVMSADGFTKPVSATLAEKVLSFATHPVASPELMRLAQGVMPRWNVPIGIGSLLMAIVVGAGIWSISQPEPTPPGPDLQMSVVEQEQNPEIGRFGKAPFQVGVSFAAGISPDGRTMFNYTQRTIQLIDLKSGEILHHFANPNRLPAQSNPATKGLPRFTHLSATMTPEVAHHAGSPPQACFTPDSQRLIVNAGMTLEIRDVQTGEILKRIPSSLFRADGKNARIEGLAIIDQQRIATVFEKDPIVFVNLETGLPDGSPNVAAADQSPFSDTGMKLRKNGTHATLWNLKTGETSGILPASLLRPAARAVMSRDGRFVAGIQPGSLSLSIHAVDGSIPPVTLIEPEKRAIETYVFTKDARELFVLVRDAIRRADVATGTWLQSWPIPMLTTNFSGNGHRNLVVSERTGQLLLLERDGVIHRWNLTTGRRQDRSGEGYRGSLKTAYDLKGRRLAIGDSSGRVEIRDERGNPQRVLMEQGQAIAGMSWSQDGKRLSVYRFDNSIAVWDADTGQRHEERTLIPTIKLPGGLDRSSVVISPDGCSSVTVINVPEGQPVKRILKVDRLDLATGKSLWPMEVVQPAVWIIASHDRTRVAAVADVENNLTQVRIHEMETGRIFGQFQVPEFVTKALISLHPDGKHIAVREPRSRCMIRDYSGTTVRNWVVADFDRVVSMCLSMTRLYLGMDDGSIRVIDQETGREIARQQGHHRGAVRELEMSPDLSRLISRSDDLTATVWDPKLLEVKR